MRYGRLTIDQDTEQGTNLYGGHLNLLRLSVVASAKFLSRQSSYDVIKAKTGDPTGSRHRPSFNTSSLLVPNDPIPICLGQHWHWTITRRSFCRSHIAQRHLWTLSTTSTGRWRWVYQPQSFPPRSPVPHPTRTLNSILNLLSLSRRQL